MRYFKFFIISLFLLLPTLLYSKIKVYDTVNNKFICYKEFISVLPAKMKMVLGEYHYNQQIQSTQSKVIKDIVKFQNLENNFTVGWEFLNYADNGHVKQVIVDYKAGQIADNEIFSKFFPNDDQADDKNKTYLPILKTVKKFNGEFIGLNISRIIKRQVIKAGVKSLDPELVPPTHELGGPLYYKRFEKVMKDSGMGGHMPEHMIRKFFEAQCFTDSVMSYQLNTVPVNDLVFMIVGSFHSDYHDGAIVQIKKLAQIPVVTTKFLDASDMTEEEISKLIIPSPTYGPLADYILFAK